jgi:hypothetical protein
LIDTSFFLTWSHLLFMSCRKNQQLFWELLRLICYSCILLLLSYLCWPSFYFNSFCVI